MRRGRDIAPVASSYDDIRLNDAAVSLRPACANETNGLNLKTSPSVSFAFFVLLP